MRNSKEERDLRAKVDALEALVVILAGRLSQDASEQRKIDEGIARDVEAFGDMGDTDGAKALLALQNDLDIERLY